MSNLVRDQLPPTFRSLYRLVLRATSASVLHHTAATRSLRALWKPTFHGATDVIRRLQSGAADVAEQQKLENWLMIWERRMDHTLSLLYNSAISRGLPHDLTRNLSFLHLGNREGSERLFFHSPQYWKPQLPSTAYHPPPESQRVKNREARLERWRDLDNSAWGALGQVVRMAEGRHGISLGRVIPLKPGLRKRRGGKFI